MIYKKHENLSYPKKHKQTCAREIERFGTETIVEKWVFNVVRWWLIQLSNYGGWRSTREKWIRFSKKRERKIGPVVHGSDKLRKWI